MKLQKLQKLQSLRSPYVSSLTIPGPEGRPGRTPIRGVDYFTPTEITAIIAAIKEQVPDGEKGEKGEDGKGGEKGNPGIDAVAPIRDVDYWTKEDREYIIQEILQRIPKDEFDKESFAQEILKRIPAPTKVGLNDVEGLPKTLTDLNELLKRGGYRGGGGRVLAGANITVVQNGDGSFTVTALPGGIQQLAATELPNGIRTVFTFSTATAKPSFVISDNVWMRSTTAAGNTNWTWNAGLKQATLVIPPQDDIFATV